jgi:hypothetical protein
MLPQHLPDDQWPPGSGHAFHDLYIIHGQWLLLLESEDVARLRLDVAISRYPTVCRILHALGGTGLQQEWLQGCTNYMETLYDRLQSAREEQADRYDDNPTHAQLHSEHIVSGIFSALSPLMLS